MLEYDFGPISRTEAGGRSDAFNLAGLPFHETTLALFASTNRDEFVAWLWHDLFKPLFYFYWPKGDKCQWYHTPGKEPFESSEAKFAEVTRVSLGMVKTHHSGKERKLSIEENDIISDQFDQAALGRKGRFLQLAFVAEPATNTALLRAVIADAFMEVVTKDVAHHIKGVLATKQPAFERVHYVFEFGKVPMSGFPTPEEIKSLADKYSMRIENSELIIHHFTPVTLPDFDRRCIEVVVDFTGNHPVPDRPGHRVISLVELLTVYQDSQTILMGIPQCLQVDVEHLTQRVKTITESRLRNLDVTWLREGVDLLAHVFAEQLDIRLIDQNEGLEHIRGYKTGKDWRPLNQIISRPAELLREKSRLCRFCNSRFDSALPMAEVSLKDVFSADFTDIEHVAFRGDICPMCRVYALNSHKSRKETDKAQGITGDRKAYRGAFALLSPSSHFASSLEGKAIDRPPLDMCERFDKQFQRVTVTLQEFALFNSVSRRIVGEIWKRQNEDETAGLTLPYLGAILLTQQQSNKVRALFDCLDALFDKVVLWAYPFRTVVQPAIEVAFEMVVNDRQKHHTKHTYLKTSPCTVPIYPDSKFSLMVDNGIQLEVNREFFESRKRLQELLSGIGGQKRQRTWLLSTIQGDDPVTAVAEASYDDPVNKAESVFWETNFTAPSLEQQWRAYEKVREEIEHIANRFPMLIEFLMKS